MTRSAIETSGCSSLRSRAIASTQRQALAGQRMAPARVGIALEQHVVARIEKDQAMLDAVARQSGENLRQLVEILGAIAHVDADRQARMQARLRLGHGGDERRHQRAGQVVDAVVVEILQRAQAQSSCPSRTCR